MVENHYFIHGCRFHNGQLHKLNLIFIIDEMTIVDFFFYIDEMTIVIGNSNIHVLKSKFEVILSRST